MKREECCEDNVEDCIAEVSEALDGIYPDLETSEGDGNAELDCDAFDDCAMAIEAAACEDWPAQTGYLGGIPVDEAACRAIIAGGIEIEAECTYNYECSEGFCSGDDGVCLAYPAVDESCANAYCDPRTTFCNGDQVCKLQLENGEDCSADTQCQSRVCDTEDTETCVAPGADECSFVPDTDTPATCSVRGGAGSGAPGGIPLALGILGIGVCVARRRRALA
jgi:hypothetical protein